MIAAASEISDNGDVKVLCVDDNPDVLLLLQTYVQHQPDMRCVGALGTADEALTFLFEAQQSEFPDVVLMDWSMPGMRVDQAITTIHRVWPQTRVVVYTAHDCQQVKDDAINAGAWGLVRKTMGMTALLDAIRRVKQGYVVLC